jgi:hypothetical protein
VIARVGIAERHRVPLATTPSRLLPTPAVRYVLRIAAAGHHHSRVAIVKPPRIR